MSGYAPKKIIVFGATGTIGRYILEALIESRKSFEKIAVFTSPQSATEKAQAFATLKDRGIEITIGDMADEKGIANVYNGFDTVVSALGRAAILMQIPLIKVAEKSNKVKRFFCSEYGTDIEYGPQSATEKPHQGKLKVRKYISENVKRLEHTYLVTGPFAEMYMMATRGNLAIGSFDVISKKACLLGDGKGKISLTTMPDVGKLLVAALKHPDASRNATLKVNSFTTTPNDIVAEFEKQMNSKWDVSYTSLEELKKIEQQAWESGQPWATAVTLRRIWTEGGTLYEARDNGKIGMKDRDMGTLEEVVATVIKSQQGE